MDPLAPSPACLRCGYSLIGLDKRRPCPECGLLSGLSYLDATELRQNLPPWLRSLTIGAVLCAAGMLLLPWIAVAAELMYTSIRRRVILGPGQPWIDWNKWGAGLVLGIVMTLTFAAGVWMMTRPARRARHDQASRGWRVGLRVLAVLPVLLVVAWAIAGSDNLPMNVANWAYSGFTMAGLLFWAAITVLLLFRYLRWLAARAPAPLLAADSPVVAVVLAAFLLSPFLVMLLAYSGLNMDPNSTSGTVFFITVVVVVAIGLTAYLWSIYLMVRYAIAFARTAREARAFMQDFDDSARA